MNQKIIIESLAMDLKREEELEKEQLDEYLKKLEIFRQVLL